MLESTYIHIYENEFVGIQHLTLGGGMLMLNGTLLAHLLRL
jgi:hypothetical protein